MDYEAKAREILNSMTLAEKIGQMCLGFISNENLNEMLEAIRQGKYGAYLTYADFSDKKDMHDKIMQASRESRTGIPVLYGKDVILGHFSVFPIGLGMAAGFNPEFAERVFSFIAEEASSEGIFWTFSPMIDVARDPRWGRIAEGFGEDTYLTSRMAEAAVWGLQGRDPEALGKQEKILACPKHFIGYGAVEGGRDANTAEISQHPLMNVYFPPFLAAMKAGAGSIMSGYHDINGEPVSASYNILTHMIKELGGLDGFIVSDFGTTAHLLKYRYTEDEGQAVDITVNSGMDMDMCSSLFTKHLEKLVEEGKIPVGRIDDAVLRILKTKLRLDLWNRKVGPLKDKGQFKLSDEAKSLSVEAARQASVLLMNKDSALPLSKDIKKLYVAGPYVHARREYFGCWCLDGVSHVIEPVIDILKRKLENVEIRHLDYFMSELILSSEDYIDTVIYFGGEAPERSGERNNITNLRLPEGQEEQIISLANRGKKVILVVVAGRPLSLARVIPYVYAILYVFHPGTGGPEAIAQILTGEAEPGGRMPVTVPVSEGQIPLYYNSIQVRSDRPEHLKYNDMTEKPLYCFGYGLTYTDFKVSDIKVDRNEIRKNESVRVTVNVENTGTRSGEAVIQCYINDCVSSLLRPCKELKGFKRVTLDKGESKIVEFTLGKEELGFFNHKGEFIVEPGSFRVFVGLDCENTIDTCFVVTD